MQHANERKENISERDNLYNNIFNTENQPLSDRNKKNNNIYYNKFTDIKEMIKKEEIKKLKKYNSSIKRILNEKNHLGRTFTQKKLDTLGFKPIFTNDYCNGKVINTYAGDKNKKKVKFNTILSGKDLIKQFSHQLDNITPSKRQLLKIRDQEKEIMVKELDKILPKQNKMYKNIKKKLGKIKKLKGSIQIKNIYKDLMKTKEKVNGYEKEKEPKLKYLYSIYNNKKFVPFKKEESENIRIKKLDHELFWTVNQFHAGN